MGNWHEWVVFGALLVVVGLGILATGDDSTQGGGAIALIGLGLLFGGAFRWAASRSDRDGSSS